MDPTQLLSSLRKSAHCSVNPIPHLGAFDSRAVADAGGAANGSLQLSINIARDSSLGNRRPSPATVVMKTVINKREQL